MGRRVLLLRAATPVSGISQSQVTPTVAVAGSTVRARVRVRNDYTWTPVGGSFASIVGGGGVPIDPLDPAQRCLDVPGGTNVLSQPADRLCVSVDGFVTPFPSAADNPAFRSGSMCMPPSDLLEVASAGSAYAHRKFKLQS